MLTKISVQTALITSYVSYKVLPTFSIFKKYTSLVPIWIKIAFFRPSQKPRIFAKISLRIFASSLRLKTSQNWPVYTGPIDDKPKVSCFGRSDTVLTGNFDSFILNVFKTLLICIVYLQKRLF